MVAYSLVLPKVITAGEMTDDPLLMVGWGGLIAFGGGFALTKIGSTRLKRFRQELNDNTISLHFGINELCIAINF